MAPEFGKIVNHFIFEQSFFSSLNKLTLIFCIEQSVVEKRTLAFRPFAVMAFSGSLNNNDNDNVMVFSGSLDNNDNVMAFSGSLENTSVNYQRYLATQ